MPQVLISYDPEVDILMVYLMHPETPLEGAEEISPGVMGHYDRRGELAQLEIERASERHPVEELMRYSMDNHIPLSEAARQSGLAHNTLRRQAINRRLTAFKQGREWWTTRAWLEEYLASRKYNAKVSAGTSSGTSPVPAR